MTSFSRTVAIPLAMIGMWVSGLVSCGDIASSPPGADVRIVLGGLSEPSQTVDVSIPSGAYDFSASATIGEGVTPVDVVVTPQGVPGEQVVTATVEIPTERITGGRVGDGCQGTVAESLAPGERLTVTIPMACGGDQPTTGATIGFSFCNNPDVTVFALHPSPPFATGSTVEVTIEVVDREPAQPISAVVAQFFGEAGGVGSPTSLPSAGAGQFSGDVAVPSTAGSYALQVTVTDPDCGDTVVTQENVEVVLP